MTRGELILRTRQLVEEGERLGADPSMGRLRLWLQLSDDLLSTAWGAMDRYHLAWLMVGKPKDVVRGRAMTPAEEAVYVQEVAAQKTAALRMSLEAAERGMPFRGEDEGLRPRHGMGEIPGDQASSPGGSEELDEQASLDGAGGPGLSRRLPLDPALAERLADARRQASEHAGHERRAPRPERMQR